MSDSPVAPGRRRQRRLAAGALLAAAGLGLAVLPVRDTWWGSWLLAVAEAGLVGGLADWFAVTALFRRPLGLPIPHTALIQGNWQRLADQVGRMIGDRVLAKTFVLEEIERLDVAEWLRVGAERLERGALEQGARLGARWVLDQLPLAALDEVGRQARWLLSASPASPALADLLEAARREGWDRRVLAAAARAMEQALDRPSVRQALVGVLDDLLERYGGRTPLSRLRLGLAEALGLLDRDRLLASLREGLRGVTRDPEHPLRRELLTALAAWSARLRDDPALRDVVERGKAQLLDSPVIESLARDAAVALHRRLLADLDAPGSAVARWIADRLDEARRRLREDAALRSEVARAVRQRLAALVERYHGDVASLVAKGVLALGPEGAARLVEEHAGDDLQYIRVNGTVVGALVGAVLHLLLHLAR